MGEPPPPAPAYPEIDDLYPRYPEMTTAVAAAGLRPEDQHLETPALVRIPTQEELMTKRKALSQLRQVMSSAIANDRTNSKGQFRVLQNGEGHNQIKSVIFEKEKNDGPQDNIRAMLRRHNTHNNEWEPWTVQGEQVFLDVHEHKDQLP